MAEEIKMESNIAINLPQTSRAMAENQKKWQWVNNENFYKMLPLAFRQFYQQWVKNWLYWYDGYVPYIHGGTQGILSTGIGTTIVNRTADVVFGGNIMFSNSRKPIDNVEKDGKMIGKALDFISNDFCEETNFKSKLKRAFANAFAGGGSLLKINKNEKGKLWVDTLRADRFYCSVTDDGSIRECISILSFLTDTTPNSKKRFVVVEHRHFQERGIFGEEFPVVEYKIFDTSAPIQYLTIQDNSVKWEQLSKSIKKEFKKQYGFRLNEPKAMNGFRDLGCYLLLGSDRVSNVPDIYFGESLLANILTYLYEFDFANTCLNTDLYVGRGRVLIPKPLQSPNKNKNGFAGYNSGFDDFIYTYYETLDNKTQKPEAIQFTLRSQEWKEIRNTLLENIATSIGLSVSTLASYLNDGSNRTAREVSAEESATALFIENARRRFEKPINELLKCVLRYYGYKDDVEIRWSRAGMTNQSVLVDTLSRAVQSGLISRKKAHDLFNYDDDEEQNAEDYKLVEEEQAQSQNSMFGGDFGEIE